MARWPASVGGADWPAPPASPVLVGAVLAATVLVEKGPTGTVLLVNPEDTLAAYVRTRLPSSIYGRFAATIGRRSGDVQVAGAL
jgi:hypothetical protein